MKTAALLAVTIALSAFAGLAAPASAAWYPGHDKPRTPTPTVSTYECGNDMGYLRRVYEEQIDQIFDEQQVSIVPICENEDYGLMRSEGNAGAIRQHLAANEAVSDALQTANFLVEDVVGVRMTGEDSAIIYVHTFLYR